MKLKIQYRDAGARQPEVVEASSVADNGHEGAWIDFLDGNDHLVLRVRAEDVDRVERVKDVKDEGSAGTSRQDVPDLSRILA
jgi:hypothetical protein